MVLVILAAAIAFILVIPREVKLYFVLLGVWIFLLAPWLQISFN